MHSKISILTDTDTITTDQYGDSQWTVWITSWMFIRHSLEVPMDLLIEAEGILIVRFGIGEPNLVARGLYCWMLVYDPC